MSFFFKFLKNFLFEIVLPVQTISNNNFYTAYVV